MAGTQRELGAELAWLARMSNADRPAFGHVIRGAKHTYLPAKIDQSSFASRVSQLRERNIDGDSLADGSHIELHSGVLSPQATVGNINLHRVSLGTRLP